MSPAKIDLNKRLTTTEKLLEISRLALRNFPRPFIQEEVERLEKEVDELRKRMRKNLR